MRVTIMNAEANVVAHFLPPATCHMPRVLSSSVGVCACMLCMILKQAKTRQNTLRISGANRNEFNMRVAGIRGGKEFV